MCYKDGKLQVTPEQEGWALGNIRSTRRSTFSCCEREPSCLRSRAAPDYDNDNDDDFDVDFYVDDYNYDYDDLAVGPSLLILWKAAPEL